MKPFAEEVRGVLVELDKDIREDIAFVPDLIDQATLSICEAVRRRVEGMKREHNPENSLVEKYIIIGHNQAIEDILKEMG